MRLHYLYIGIVTMVASLAACNDDIDQVEDQLQLGRVLSPMDLKAVIRDKTTIEMDWALRDDADHYVVEFSEDSLAFTNIIRTITVAPDDLPLRQTFFGDTRYSARVKGVSADGVDDSKWVATTIRTESENLFTPLDNEGLSEEGATLRWTAGETVSHIIVMPGNINRTISADEQTAGEVNVSGLDGRTSYTATLYSGTSKRGVQQFKTLIDPDGPNTTAVHPEEDINAVITAAATGSILVFYPGDYSVYKGNIIINKAIALVGYKPFDKPALHVQFSLEGSPTSVELTDLDINGDATYNDVVRYNTASVEYGDLTISGCKIHDFTRSLIGGTVASKVASVTIDNCILTDIVSSGGDFIDLRATYLANLKITNSTFDNCAPGRDFVRIDNAGLTGTGLNTTVLIDHCTLYGVSNTQDRILYVRFATNTLTVRNTLIAATDGYYTNQASSSQPVCSGNNYFNAIGFYTAAYVANAKVDDSGTHTILDPGFKDAINGDFTLSNQTLKDKGTGDPRWVQP